MIEIVEQYQRSSGAVYVASTRKVADKRQHIYREKMRHEPALWLLGRVARAIAATQSV
jgi:hypothetical protein